MVLKEMVSQVHDNLQALKQELHGGVDPAQVLAGVIENLLMLTDLPNHEDETDEAIKESPASGDRVLLPPAPGPCKHPSVNVYGRCPVCGTCTHTNIKNGICLTCDEEMPASVSQDHLS